MPAPESPPNGLTLVTTFAGCGGSSCGYHAAGYDVRLAIEWDAGACSAYRANFPGTPVFEGDIASLGAEEALKLACVGPGELDVLDGSPPCQGFSTAGKRRYMDRRNQLFREFVRLLGAFRPRAFVMENVSGLRKGKMRILFAEMTTALEEAGYRVACRELNAWWYGTPQDRRRLIWVGIREDIGVAPSHPRPTRRVPVTVGDACPWISSFRNDDNVQGGGTGSYVDVGGRPSPTLTASKGLGGVNSYHFTVSCAADPHPEEELAPTRVPAHYAVSRAWHRRRAGGHDPASYLFNLTFAETAKPAPTLAAEWGKSLSMAALMHPYECRRLTIREAKRLTGFPDAFDLAFLPYGEAWSLIGNSVPPPLAEAVGRHVASLLAQADGRADEPGAGHGPPPDVGLPDAHDAPA